MTPTQAGPAITPARLSHQGRVAFLAYLAFVIYGSLVPLDFRPHSLAAAFHQFAHIPWLHLGVEKRADWVANAVLYAPLAFLGCVMFANAPSRPARARRVGLVFLFCVAVAVGVEFTQIFFPPRTVSLNDILSETIGSAIGAGAWWTRRDSLFRLWRDFLAGGRLALQAVLVAAAIAYLLFCLFPFDFVLSASELRFHLDSPQVAWLITGGHGTLRTLIGLSGEMVAIAPLGVLIGLLARRADPRRLFVSGAILGLVLELIQLFVFSAVVQGVSVLTRAAGLTAGAWLGQQLRRHGMTPLARLLQRSQTILLVPYLLALALISGWWHPHLASPAQALAQLEAVHWLPFWYYYYTTEASALPSFVANLVIYAPLGILAWARQTQRTQAPLRGPYEPAVWAFALASVVEAARAWLLGHHPDPTNPLIGAAGATGAYLAMIWLERTVRQAAGTTPGPSLQAPATDMPATPPMQAPVRVRSDDQSGDPGPGGHPWARPLAVLGLLAGFAATITDPFHPIVQAILMAAYALWLWRRPAGWPIWVLALLPMLDFLPETGRLFWSEFDSLLLVTLGIAYWRIRPAGLDRLQGAGAILLVGYSLSALLALLIGLWPFPPLDINALNDYLSHYNALRAAKGLAFMLAFLPLLARQWEEPEAFTGRLALGMTLGLALEILYVLWERVTFSGLFNFASGYRITGSFPMMQTGGAYIECYLTLSLPFVLLWAWRHRRPLPVMLAILLYSLGAYSVMVTFARGGELAFIIATAIAALGFGRVLLSRRSWRLPGLASIALILLAAGLVVTPIITGRFNEARLATNWASATTRLDHWRDALQILERDHALLLGEGLGSFPRVYFWESSARSRPGTYAFVRHGGNTFLRLGSGETLYFEQLVDVAPNTHYRLTLDLRANSRKAALSVPLCEKAVLYSYTCDWHTLTLKGPKNTWRRYRVELFTKDFGPPGSWFPRPVKLTLFNPKGGTLVDVDNVSLSDPAGHQLIRNGTFSQDMAHWDFSTDNLVAWQAQNLAVHVLFEQGIIGLLLFVGLVGYALLRTLRWGWAGQPLGITLTASLTAFLVVGVIDSLIDETRIGFLCFLLCGIGLLKSPQGWLAERHGSPYAGHARPRN